MSISMINRDSPLFYDDILNNHDILIEKVSKSSFLVIGGAGTIGKAVTKEIFKRSPKRLHVVDISENNLVELVRDIRSSYGYISGDFKTFAIDIGSKIFDAFFNSDGDYDYILNLSALKHVRSEKDPYTLMRMIEVNILNTIKTINLAKKKRIKNYFCVSTDKAANPINMMGASKRIMEMFLMREAKDIRITSARFANVAFSDGSLLYGFQQRFNKKQPIAGPSDIKRYFITEQESGELCLIASLLGHNKNIFFPKLSDKFDLITFQSIAEKFLKEKGFKLFNCSSEAEARLKMNELSEQGKWPCYFSTSNTTGEKPFEEFFLKSEKIDNDSYTSLGVIKSELTIKENKLDEFLEEIAHLKQRNNWVKSELVSIFKNVIPEFEHKETKQYLDRKM